MSEQTKIEIKDGYILATISDTVITNERAHEALDLIGQECIRLKCNKVLLDERTVESRDVSPPEILKLGRDFPRKALDKIYIAFWCKKHLIDKDAELLKLFTFTNEFIIQYFTGSDDAIAWLNTK